MMIMVFLGVHLNKYTPINILNNKTQGYALDHNWKLNNIEESNLTVCYAKETIATELTFGIIRVPKTIDLFELYLQQIHAAIAQNGTILCPFMTKYFTPQLVKVAEKYFETVTQSRAEKKHVYLC